MEEYIIVGGMVFVLLIIFQAQDTNHKFRRLHETIRYLRHELHLAHQKNKDLQMECLILRTRDHAQTGASPFTPPYAQKENLWQVAWARELLDMHEEVITEDSLRNARKQALKKTHPDTGGHADRFRSVEDAVEVLRRKIS